MFADTNSALSPESIEGKLSSSAHFVPTYCGISRFLEPTYAPVFFESEAMRYLIYIGKGVDSCGLDCSAPGSVRTQPQDLQALTSKLKNETGIRTLAIAMNSENHSPNESLLLLNGMTRGGGTGLQKSIRVQSEDELAEAFESIHTTISQACIYDLGRNAHLYGHDGILADLVNLEIEGQATALHENCSDGASWRWFDKATATLALCPSACEQLIAGEIESVTVRQGCM